MGARLPCRQSAHGEGQFGVHRPLGQGPQTAHGRGRFGRVDVRAVAWVGQVTREEYSVVNSRKREAMCSTCPLNSRR
ncbi:hypothetical protein GCM10010521_65300 [Streptomyces rameus]|uniref:Uncharacterized protein n=1 Tax=Streptomyces rameus TaxID=68261 RepID=A0ABN3V4H0_9ACTN